MRSCARLLPVISIWFAVSASADTGFVLEIDSDMSSLTGSCRVLQCDMQSCHEACEPLPSFIGGRFELRIIEPGYLGNLRLSDLSVSTGDLSEAFRFPAINAELDSAERIFGTDDFCYWFNLSGQGGSCFSIGDFESFTGTFDGSSLHIVGFYYYEDSDFSQYRYEIAASVVPEPTAALLNATALLVLVGLRKRVRPSSAVC